MKKFLLVILSCLVFAGCSCSNEECKCPNDTTNTENVEKVVVTDYSELYRQTVRSVVMIKVQKKNDKNNVISTGSGVVAYEGDGRAYIYTNAHVVEKLTTEYEVEVFFSNELGRLSGSSEIVNYNYVYKDIYEDVAVIEINKSEKYKLATLANSDLVENGDFVYTIGSPLANFNYTTSGNVSSVKVPVELKHGLVAYTIMMDATINGGNSGGAVFDKEGKLIGITTFEYNVIPGLYGILPINYFDKVAKFLLSSNISRYTRPTLNLDLSSIDEMGSKKQSYGISDYISTGVYITSSRETISGIYSDTIITAVNGKTITSKTDYEIELLKYKVGDKITITTINTDGLNIQHKEVTLHG